MRNFLSSPMWQGVSAITGILALALTLYVARNDLFHSPVEGNTSSLPTASPNINSTTINSEQTQIPTPFTKSSNGNTSASSNQVIPTNVPVLDPMSVSSPSTASNARVWLRLLSWTILGFVLSWFIRVSKSDPQLGILLYLILGIIGSLLGATLGNYLKYNQLNLEWSWLSIATSVSTVFLLMPIATLLYKKTESTN